MTSNDVETVNGLPILVNQEPKPTPLRELINSSKPIDNIAAIQAIVRWRYERGKYPGWLIPTSEKRDSLWRNTTPYVQKIFAIIQDWPYEDQILFYREVIWRLDVSLLPLDSQLVELLEPTVNELFTMLRNESSLNHLSQMKILLDMSDTDVHESWIESALALLRDARESFDKERWEMFADMISQLIHVCPQYNDKYSYEQVLWHLWNLERREARNLLNQWSPSANAFLDLIRKSGLLVELDDWGEARSLLQAALKDIRHSFYRKPGLNVDLLSLEGWCMYLLLAVEAHFDTYDTPQESQVDNYLNNLSQTHQQFVKRWDELKAWDSDPWSHIEHFRQILSGEPPDAKETERIVPGFDVGSYTVSHSFVDTPDTSRLQAYSFLRLHDVLGIPLHLSSKLLQKVAEWLVSSSSFLSPMILIRAGNVKEIADANFMSRAQIASMDSDLAYRLNSWAMKALHNELPSLRNMIRMDSKQASLLETLIEFMSRLTIKIGNNDLQDAFNMALDLHSQPGFKSHIRLNRFCERWFKRLFDAANSRQLITWIPDLLRFPLSMNSDASESSLHSLFSWPDPMITFDSDSVRDLQEINPELKSELNNAIDWLLFNTPSMGESRQRALVRLYLVFHSNLMTEEQERQFGTLLWGNATTAGLPDLPNLPVFNYLHLPSPSEIDAQSILKQHLLSLKPRKSVSLEDSRINVSAPGESEDRMIHDVSNSSKPVIRLPGESQGKIEWSLTEAKDLWRKVYEWWNNDKHAIKHSNLAFRGFGEFDRYAKNTTVRISQFLARVVLPYLDSSHEEEWTQILNLLSETREDKIHLTQSLPYILLHQPSEFDKILSIIRHDLFSNDEEKVIAAAQAVSHWAYLTDETCVTPVPPILINDLLNTVVFRLTKGVESCLYHLAVIVENKPDQINHNQAQLISSSLNIWLQTVHIPISESNITGFPEHKIPLLRSRLASLAFALSEWYKSRQPDQPEPSEITHLLKLFKSDPLPEVRRSVGIY